jgi:hypothetical protein
VDIRAILERSILDFLEPEGKESPTPGNAGLNIFISNRGYIGHSVLDSTDGPPVVQVGDLIGVFDDASPPFILRPYGDGTFAFVGPAYILEMDKAPCFHSGEQLPVQKFVIR